MKWKLPHVSKVYEALGAIADHRTLQGPAEGGGGQIAAKVYSSSRNKFYDVTFDPENNAIMSNDNSAYWKGELGYPAIALLMELGVLPFDEQVAESLKGIAWKDLNQANKNNFDKTIEQVLNRVDSFGPPGTKSKDVKKFCEQVLEAIKELDLARLGPKQRPPAGY
jgi:hypothetical protein